MITINEADTSRYETEVLTVSDYILDGGEHLTEFNEITMLDAIFGKLQEVLMKLYITMIHTLFLL